MTANAQRIGRTALLFGLFTVLAVASSVSAQEGARVVWRTSPMREDVATHFHVTPYSDKILFGLFYKDHVEQGVGPVGSNTFMFVRAADGRVLRSQTHDDFEWYGEPVAVQTKGLVFLSGTRSTSLLQAYFAEDLSEAYVSIAWKYRWKNDRRPELLGVSWKPERADGPTDPDDPEDAWWPRTGYPPAPRLFVSEWGGIESREVSSGESVQYFKADSYVVPGPLSFGTERIFCFLEGREPFLRPCILDVGRKEVAWKAGDELSQVTAWCAHEGSIYATTADGALHVLDPETGERTGGKRAVFEQPPDSLVVIGNKIVAVAETDAKLAERPSWRYYLSTDGIGLSITIVDKGGWEVTGRADVPRAAWEVAALKHGISVLTPRDVLLVTLDGKVRPAGLDEPLAFYPSSPANIGNSVFVFSKAGEMLCVEFPDGQPGVTEPAETK